MLITIIKIFDNKDTTKCENESLEDYPEKMPYVYPLLPKLRQGVLLNLDVRLPS